jgi:L-ascorbate metabolism protein UlaG (beta-lactamase superfamily)
MNIHYIGHSGFFIQSEDAGILIDPFISGNPQAAVNFDMSAVKDILITHGHHDHLGDAVDISKQTGARITAVFELANYCAALGAAAIGMNIGGNIQLYGATARVAPAFHSSANNEGVYLGCPCSFLLNAGGKTIYHAGDNCLNSEMKMLGELYKIDVAMLPVGGHFTMDANDAVIAAKWLNAETVIPMHYDTFPPIKVGNDGLKVFSDKISGIGKKPYIMRPGEFVDI